MSADAWWPLDWSMMTLAAAALVGFSWLAAVLVVRQRNHRLAPLVDALEAHGIFQQGATYAVGEGKSLLVVAGERLVMTDTFNARVVQTADIATASGLKVYEDSSDTMAFRILLEGDAQTRKVTTRSVTDLARVFTLMTSAGKSIEYIQE